MVHVDVKKVGRIPDGGGWRAHGKGSAKAKAAARARANKPSRLGYTYLHSAVDGHTRLAYTEALTDEQAATAIGFLDRAAVFFTAHGITRIERVVTHNGSCYRAADYATAVTATFGAGDRQQRIRPYTPRHNGKVERYNRILSDEFLYAETWTSDHQRTHQLSVWNVHYNYHRRHTAIGDILPAAACPQRVTNVMASYN